MYDTLYNDVLHDTQNLQLTPLNQKRKKIQSRPFVTHLICYNLFGMLIKFILVLCGDDLDTI